MNRHIRRFAVAGLVAVWALSGSGCSTATKFGYNHLDWFAKREIGKYFDLTQRQEDWFKPRFEALWLWHRHEQLPLYVADLRSLAEQAQQPLSREHITQALTMIQGHVRPTPERATPDTVTLLAMLDEAQRSSLRDERDHIIAEAHDKRPDPPD